MSNYNHYTYFVIVWEYFFVTSFVLARSWHHLNVGLRWSSPNTTMYPIAGFKTIQQKVHCYKAIPTILWVTLSPQPTALANQRPRVRFLLAVPRIFGELNQCRPELGFRQDCGRKGIRCKTSPQSLFRSQSTEHLSAAAIQHVVMSGKRMNIQR